MLFGLPTSDPLLDSTDCFGSLFGSLGWLLAALGAVSGRSCELWEVLVAQGPDLKAILSIPGGQGRGNGAAIGWTYPPGRFSRFPPTFAVNSSDSEDP